MNLDACSFKECRKIRCGNSRGVSELKKYQNAKIQPRPTWRVVIYQAHEGCTIEGRPGQPGLPQEAGDAVYFRIRAFWYISLPSFAKQQREMTKFKVLRRT